MFDRSFEDPGFSRRLLTGRPVIIVDCAEGVSIRDDEVVGDLVKGLDRRRRARRNVVKEVRVPIPLATKGDGEGGGNVGK